MLRSARLALIAVACSIVLCDFPAAVNAADTAVCRPLIERVEGYRSKGEELPAYLMRALRANGCPGFEQPQPRSQPSEAETIEQLRQRIQELEQENAKLEREAAALRERLEEASPPNRVAGGRPESSTFREKVEDAYGNGLMNDFALWFLDGTADYEVTNVGDRGTIWRKLSLKVDRTSADDLYVITPRWAADDGKIYEVGKNSGKLIWQSLIGIMEPYQFYLYVPDSGWSPPSGKVHIAPHPNMRNFDITEFQIRMALTGARNEQGQYDYRYIYNPVAQRAKPGCGPTWIRTERDLLSDARQEIRDVLFVQPYADCLVAQAQPEAGRTEDRSEAPDIRTYFAALKLQSREGQALTVASVRSDGLELGGDFVGGQGYHHDESENLHLISGPVAAGATVVDLSVKLDQCAKPIEMEISVNNVLVTEGGPGGVLASLFEISRMPIIIDVDTCFQLASMTYFFKDAPDDAGVDVLSDYAIEAGLISKFAPGDVGPTGEVIASGELAIAFEDELRAPRFAFIRPGYVTEEFPIAAFQAGKDNANGFPSLTLEARRLMLRLEGTSRAPERVSIISHDGEIRDLTATTNYRPSAANGRKHKNGILAYEVEAAPNYEPKEAFLQIQLPSWQTADEVLGWHAMSARPNVILRSIVQERLPLFETDPDNSTQPSPFLLRVRPHDQEVTIRGQPVSVTTPIHTDEGTFDLAALPDESRGCRAGLRLVDDETIYWLKRSDDKTWAVPEDFPPVSPVARLEVVAEARDPGKGDYHLACDGKEITSKVAALSILEGEGLTVPVKRPILVYILREFDGDQRVGERNARIFWEELLALVGKVVEDRIYVVRYKPDIDGFKTLSGPNGFAVSPSFDYDRFERNTAKSRHAPSLNQVVVDAKIIIKQFARDDAELAADVVILASNSPKCRTAERNLAGLSDPTDGSAPARVLLLADSDSPEVRRMRVSDDKITYAADCAKDVGVDNLDIHIANVEEASARKYPLFAEGNWRKALDRLKSP